MPRKEAESRARRRDERSIRRGGRRDRPRPRISGIRIAGIELAVSGIPHQGLKFANPLYRRFRVPAAPHRADQRIDIRMRCSAYPEPRGKEMLFDTEEAWALYGDRAHFWVVYRPPRYEKPFWVAAFDRRVTRVEYFSEPLPPVGGKTPAKIVHPVGYPLDQLLLMYFLARRRGILTHAAGLVRGGRAYLFAGASGAGKSTLSALLAKAGIGKMLSDERMIVREVQGEMTAFGTPWAGTAGIARGGSAPLAGILFLAHGKSHRMQQLDPAAALDRLLPLASIPWYDPDAAAPIIAFAKDMLARIPACEFRFAPDPSAVEFFERRMRTPA